MILNKNNIYQYIFLMLVCSIIASVIIQSYNIKINRKILFDQQSIDGRITSITYGRGIIKLKTDDQNSEVFFSPSFNGSSFFHRTANIGDKVIKPQYSNSIKLISKEGREIEYQIKK